MIFSSSRKDAGSIDELGKKLGAVVRTRCAHALHSTESRVMRQAGPHYSSTSIVIPSGAARSRGICFSCGPDRSKSRFLTPFGMTSPQD